MSARCVRQRRDEHVSQVVSALDWGSVRRGASQLSGRGGRAGMAGWLDGWLAVRPSAQPPCATGSTHQLRKSTGPVRLRPDSKPHREGRRRPVFPPCDVSNSPRMISFVNRPIASRGCPRTTFVWGSTGRNVNVGFGCSGGSFPSPGVGGGWVCCWKSRSGNREGVMILRTK